MTISTTWACRTCSKPIDKGDDDLTVVMKLNKPNAPIIANLAMDFATIQSAEYAELPDEEGNA